MTRNELVFVTPGAFLNSVTYVGRQPTTGDIANVRTRGRFVMQLIGGQINVYATNTLRHQPMVGWTIGVPKFVTEDFDAAVMWAMLQGEK